MLSVSQTGTSKSQLKAVQPTSVQPTGCPAYTPEAGCQAPAEEPKMTTMKEAIFRLIVSITSFPEPRVVDRSSFVRLHLMQHGKPIKSKVERMRRIALCQNAEYRVAFMRRRDIRFRSQGCWTLMTFRRQSRTPVTQVRALLGPVPQKCVRVQKTGMGGGPPGRRTRRISLRARGRSSTPRCLGRLQGTQAAVEDD